MDTNGSAEHDGLELDLSDPFKLGANRPSELKRKVESARTEGWLNIANMELKEIPKQVYSMYESNDDDDAAQDDGPKWYESVDLVRLIAADNDIEEVGEELARMFGGLQAIDVRQIIYLARL